ncbi:hypothetical protein LS72_010120 [Helicobacter apodemus]|uniref:Uncharacterized protein n=1 Tax=Helicobacter apodemus TaxID=135569 RepID=A0A4U8UCL4_9HELI|nr:hypothetical protein [Helicobacter apodemus]TLE13246.1 hypothetical protein LS72_010120 [Helicobacter apodemus]
MNLKQIQKITFDRCDGEVMLDRVGYVWQNYLYVDDLQPSRPTIRDIKDILLSTTYSKQEIRSFFSAKYCIKYYTANDGRGEWINTKGEYLFFGN